MTLVRYSPSITPRLAFDRDLFARWADEFFNTPSTGEWYPRADVVETEKGYEISVELPGVEKDQVKVSVENRVLSISGETKSEYKDEGNTYYRLERRYGAFARSFELPDSVEADKIEATFKNGVLKLVIPKMAEVLPRKIEIKG